MDDREPERDVQGLTFSFICEVLALDPNYLRKGLERWRQRAARESPL